MPANYLGDDHRLAQIITNLLSNAVKFTPENGEIKLNVSLQNQRDNKCELRFEVADSGIGMTDEQQSKLFQKFQQAESGTSRKFGGTGLGLVITKHIIELMEGNICVESEINKSTQFIFTIKLSLSKNNYIFMDIHMPEMDGYEATQLIRAFEKTQVEKNKEKGSMEYAHAYSNCSYDS